MEKFEDLPVDCKEIREIGMKSGYSVYPISVESSVPGWLCVEGEESDVYILISEIERIDIM